MLKALIEQVVLTWRLFRDPRVPLWSKIIPVIGVIYVLSPLDLIPDIIIGLGQLDDLGIILGAMRLFEAVTPEYIVQEHRADIARSNAPMEFINSTRYRIFHQDDAKEKNKRG